MDSWETHAGGKEAEEKAASGAGGGQGGGGGSSMNPNAASFSFNPNASGWTPGGGASFTPAAAAAAAPPPPPPPPAAAAQDVTEKLGGVTISVGAPSAAAEGGGEDEEADVVDESDPLWQVTLRIAGGDRKKAVKMLEDPDSLMSHPEVLKVIEATEGTVEDDAEDYGGESGASEAVAAAGAGAAAVAAAAPASAPPGAKSTGDDEEEDEEGQDAEEEAEAGDEDEREHLNIVFIGHVDAGKSTLSGNILYLTDFVDKRTIERYEREAKQRNRETWFLAFIMDTNEEERAKGKTVEVGRAHFETDTKRYTILDAPGHSAYVPNMIQGAAQADVGILVISARKGEFETGFEKGGQTREHALLAKTLGVRYLVVVINKMDDPTVEWAKTRFDECVSKLKPFLRSCGYAVKKDVTFIPISGLAGSNIKVPVTKDVCPWWSESVAAGENNTTSATLLKLMDDLSMDNRDSSASLRVPVLDRYTDRGTIALGKVERGTLRTGSSVVVMPTRTEAKVEAIYINDVKVKTAKTGENVSVKLNIPDSDVVKGFVICDPSDPCKASKKVLCQVAVIDMLDKRSLFTAGYDSVFHCHTVEEECIVSSLVDVIDMKTGKPSKSGKKPAFVKEGAVVRAVLEVPRSICVEKYDVMPQMGRITLRTEGHTIAIGKILEIKE